MFLVRGTVCGPVSIRLGVLLGDSMKFEDRQVLGRNIPGKDSGMAIVNVRRRSARSKSYSFQYRVRLAGCMTHTRSHEVSCFLFERSRPVRQTIRENREQNLGAEGTVNVERTKSTLLCWSGLPATQTNNVPN